MKDIIAIYIMDYNDNPTFVYDSRDRTPIKKSNLFRIINVVEKLSFEMHGKLDSLELGEFVYYYEEDEITNDKFIFKCAKDVQNEDIEDFAVDIRNMYLTDFMGYHAMNEQKKKATNKKFRKKVEERLDRYIGGIEDLLSLL